jgi:Zn-finger nucleic acid-binding protein
MNCPSCGAPMHADGDCLKCAYCQNIYFPEKDDSGVRVLGEASELGCPVCKVPLVQATIAGSDLLYCTRCRGMLIAMGVFGTLVDTLHAQGGAAIPPTTDGGDATRRIDCPHCHRSMEAHTYAGAGNVMIDSCEQCLLNWLDHGELMRIVHAPDHLSSGSYFETAVDSSDDSAS